MKGLVDEAIAEDDIEKKRLKVEELIRLSRKEEPNETEQIELEDRHRLGIATVGALKQHPRISAFRRFIEGWYLSYFTPAAARSLPLAGPQRHLNSQGDNLGNIVKGTISATSCNSWSANIRNVSRLY